MSLRLTCSWAASAGGAAPNPEVAAAPSEQKGPGTLTLAGGESAGQPQLGQLSRSAIQAASCVREKGSALLLLPGALCGTEKSVCGV